jgi:hypothetical protein
LSRTPIVLSAFALVVALALSACGGSSGNDAQDGSASTGSSNGQGNGPNAALQDPDVQKCLKKQGVTVPTAPPGGNGNGQMPYGGGPPPQDGEQQAPPDGERPRNGGGPGGMSGELRAALKKCGVTLPDAGQGAPPGRTSTTTATTVS